MTTPRNIAPVVRKVRLDELDEDAERLKYWKTRSPAERFAEVESLRRLWIEITGDPDLPMVRVVHRRRLGDQATEMSTVRCTIESHGGIPTRGGNRKLPGRVRHCGGSTARGRRETMPLQVVNGAATVCTLGTAPSKLLVLPTHRRTAGGQPAANIQDHVPTMNIAPFGLCKSPTFPGTIAATSAALGVFTPAPCVPLTDTPWIPGSPIVTIADQPALRQTDVCQCFWGGTVSITDPGQKIVDDK